jgi:dihydropteroate synthase
MFVATIREAIEYGFDQTVDVDGPNFTYMAQVVNDRVVKAGVTTEEEDGLHG